jgi:FkbM family methyltransferase
MLSAGDEQRLVRLFFGDGPGFFVEVGANHPERGSQSWHLEQRGWSGILVEPNPEFAVLLRQRRRARVFEIACSSPANAGKLLPFHVAGAMSSLSRETMVPGAHPNARIDVAIRTLDDVLAEADAPRPLDFLTVDVEGHEIEVLSGFAFARWQPRLVLLEDHVADLRRHHLMKSVGYRIIRHTGLNGWYVPNGSPVSASWADRCQIFRKYYLALPLRAARNFSRRLRQPLKDWMR